MRWPIWRSFSQPPRWRSYWLGTGAGRWGLDKLLPNMDIEGSSLEKEAERSGHYKPTPRAVPQAQS